LQKNVTRRNNIGKTKFKGFSLVATTRKIELLVNSLSISKFVGMHGLLILELHNI
jgi:hypothetical protein